VSLLVSVLWVGLGCLIVGVFDFRWPLLSYLRLLFERGVFCTFGALRWLLCLSERLCSGGQHCCIVGRGIVVLCNWGWDCAVGVRIVMMGYFFLLVMGWVFVVVTFGCLISLEIFGDLGLE